LRTLFLHSYSHRRALHSFPTRRSSDLLNYLPRDEEIAIVQARVPQLADAASRPLLESMVAVAELTRKGFAAGDLSTLMSPRTVRSEEHTSELQSRENLVCRLLLEKKKS